MSKHRLYYSTRCRFSQAFLEELAKTPFVPEFQLVCVDPSPSRPPLPPWLKSVPSMMAVGESTPRVGPGPVNNWLFERKLGSGGTPKTAIEAMEERSKPLAMPVYTPEIAPRPNPTSRGGSSGSSASGSSGSSASGSSASGAGSATSAEGPAAYHHSEMGATKWSDNYSFLGGAEFVSDKGYDPIARNFESLLPVAGAGAGAGGGGASVASAAKRTVKEEQLLSEFEQFTKDRDRDVAPPIARR